MKHLTPRHWYNILGTYRAIPLFFQMHFGEFSIQRKIVSLRIGNTSMRFIWQWISERTNSEHSGSKQRQAKEEKRKPPTKMGKENVKGEEEAAKEKQSVCKRCKETYSASSNTPTSCRYHPSFFVCRRHDDQRR